MREWGTACCLTGERRWLKAGQAYTSTGGSLLVLILEGNISHHPAGWVILHINRRRSNIQPVALQRKIGNTSAGHAFSRKPSGWKKKQGKPKHLPPRLRPEHATVPAFRE